MAEVFLGSTMGAEGFSRRVAIKRVLPGFSDNAAFANMFVDEARLSGKLVHPNIVSVLDFDRDAENRLFLVMELVEGKDLDALLATGVVPVPVVIYVIGEVLRGLGYAHDLPAGDDVRGIIHRDVSPHNVLLSWEGAVKVSDFGIAKARAASEATASVFIKGKPAYMSPEQANGQPLDGRSDLFAVGIMLWEMLVGQRLFTGSDTRSTLAAVLFGQIPRPRALRGDVPKDLERVVMKLLERDLPARYTTAEQAIRDLMRCADAPRSGREVLIATLAERFAGVAPVRGSVRRAQSMPPAAQGLAMQSTQPDGAVGPAHAQPSPALAPMSMPRVDQPSLGALRNAPTGTIDHPGLAPQRSRRRALLVVALVVAVSAIVTFAIVSGMRGGASGTPAGSGSQVAVSMPAPDAAPAPPVDAAPAPPPVDAPPIPEDAAPRRGTHAATGIRKKPDAGVAEVVQAPPPPDPGPVGPVKTGKLAVKGLPSLALWVNDVRRGESPCEITLPVGSYRVTLKSQDSEHPQETSTTEVVREHQTTIVKRPP